MKTEAKSEKEIDKIRSELSKLQMYYELESARCRKALEEGDRMLIGVPSLQGGRSLEGGKAAADDMNTGLLVTPRWRVKDSNSEFKQLKSVGMRRPMTSAGFYRNKELRDIEADDLLSNLAKSWNRNGENEQLSVEIPTRPQTSYTRRKTGYRMQQRKRRNLTVDVSADSREKPPRKLVGSPSSARMRQPCKVKAVPVSVQLSPGFVEHLETAGVEVFSFERAEANTTPNGLEQVQEAASDEGVASDEEVLGNSSSEEEADVLEQPEGENLVKLAAVEGKDDVITTHRGNIAEIFGDL